MVTGYILQHINIKLFFLYFFFLKLQNSFQNNIKEHDRVDEHDEKRLKPLLQLGTGLEHTHTHTQVCEQQALEFCSIRSVVAMVLCSIFLRRHGNVEKTMAGVKLSAKWVKNIQVR